MKIAIVGGGFTGLAAGVELVDRGDEVVIFEYEKKLGGLAVGFKDPDWDWSLEKFYHHIFANDASIIDLAKKVGLPALFSIPKTNSFVDGDQLQLDSPLSLMKFSKISITSRIHMGIGLLILKLIPNGVFLEKWKAVEMLPWLLGREGYEKIWKPLLSAKFGPYIDQVNLAWFWARVYKRTQSLGYFPGGFSALADKIGEYITKKEGKIKLGVEVKKITEDKDGMWRVNDEKFDAVLITSPAPLVDKLIGSGLIDWPKINYLFAQTLILELDRSFMKGYWLNILEKDFPFLVVVEHTNFADRSHYGNKTILYLGNYLSQNDKRLGLKEEKMLDLYEPYLKKINPKFERAWIKKNWFFESPFAQPVFPTNYSKQIPSSRTGISGLVIANMSMVYPWDRGTNYAVELGQKVAKIIHYG